ncbi:hypothetical protein A3F66_06715 [candidate division TM6 bacterium RIFCSPHIGHO2_12_FULL_32_22]|nr:MAG: hypothetical protein A3F66_06715 [candidate division TM6 bacterium RIFCSPHIGHO2_12_FULL_32_22]
MNKATIVFVLLTSFSINCRFTHLKHFVRTFGSHNFPRSKHEKILEYYRKMDIWNLNLELQLLYKMLESTNNKLTRQLIQEDIAFIEACIEQVEC